MRGLVKTDVLDFKLEMTAIHLPFFFLIRNLFHRVCNYPKLFSEQIPKSVCKVKTSVDLLQKIWCGTEARGKTPRRGGRTFDAVSLKRSSQFQHKREEGAAGHLRKWGPHWTPMRSLSARSVRECMCEWWVGEQLAIHNADDASSEWIRGNGWRLWA